MSTMSTMTVAVALTVITLLSPALSAPQRPRGRQPSQQPGGQQGGQQSNLGDRWASSILGSDGDAFGPGPSPAGQENPGWGGGSGWTQPPPDSPWPAPPQGSANPAPGNGGRDPNPSAITGALPSFAAQPDCGCFSTAEYNPVCGSDGTTYENLSKLRCARACGNNASLQQTHQGACSPPPAANN